ncbi:sensor histidine kinase [Psychromonas sp.]|nr:sensor histidine kinase [Psychromonas sp.]
MIQGVYNKKNYLLITLLLFISPLVCANNTLDLEHIGQLYDINSSSSAQGFFPISDETIIDSTFYDAQEWHLKQFAMRPDFSVSKRFGLLISLKNKTQIDTWFVHISHYLIDQIDVYVKTDSGIEHAIIASLLPSDSSFSANMLGRAVPIALPKNESADLLVVLTSYKMKFPLYIGLIAETEYHNWKRNMDLVFIVAMGIMLGFVLLSATSFVILREQMLAWFSISTILFLFFIVLRSPFGIDMLEWKSGLPFAGSVAIALSQISMLVFTKLFINIPVNSLSTRYFDWLIGLICISIIASLFASNSFNVVMHSFLGLLVIVLIVWISIMQAIKQGALFIVFMLGWLPLLYYVGEVIYLQHMQLKLGETTFSYNNIESLYLQIVHFFIHFIVMVFRILQIKRDRITAEMKSEAKTTFLAQLSHDLRQPLDTMGLFLDHLQDKIHHKENATLLHKTKKIHYSMREILSGLLNLSQLEAGKMPVTIQDVNIPSLFEELNHEYEQNTSAKKLRYHSRECKAVIKTDYVLLKRLLGNLLSNATKYTTTGGVFMSARCRSDHILLQVWDTGKGISAHEQKLIFDLYQRSEKNDPTTQSTGVGLATVQHIAMLLDFKVTLRSTLGKGSVFSVFIPYDKQR